LLTVYKQDEISISRLHHGSVMDKSRVWPQTKFSDGIIAVLSKRSTDTLGKIT